MLGFTVIFLASSVGIRGEDATTEPPHPDYITILFSKESYALQQVTTSLQQTISDAKKTMPSDMPDKKEQQNTLDKLYEIIIASWGDISNVSNVLTHFTSFKSDLEWILQKIQSMLTKAEGTYKEELQKVTEYIQQSLPLIEKLIQFCKDSEAGRPIPDTCVKCWFAKEFHQFPY